MQVKGFLSDVDAKAFNEFIDWLWNKVDNLEFIIKNTVFRKETILPSGHYTKPD